MTFEVRFFVFLKRKSELAIFPKSRKYLWKSYYRVYPGVRMKTRKFIIFLLITSHLCSHPISQKLAPNFTSCVHGDIAF
jgi:hypothetical protein